jgi:hypothetical protein
VKIKAEIGNTQMAATGTRSDSKISSTLYIV